MLKIGIKYFLFRKDFYFYFRKLKPDIEDYLEHTKPGSNPNCDDYIPDKVMKKNMERP